MNTNHIRTLLKNDKVKEALESLSALTDRSSHRDRAILLQGRYSVCKSENEKGYSMKDEYLRIIEAALTFCNDLDADKSLSRHANFRQQIDISHLPTLQPHFVGREEELKLLDQCWQNPQANLLEFIAPGGTGKTTLVTWWLLHRLPNLEEQPEAIFAFSFYSQGTGDHRQSSSDPFFSRANDFLGVQNPPTDPRERARALVEAIRARKAILVLDGIEPLQYPPGPLEGQLKDPALRYLLKELAAAQPGLCICTTRVPMSELAGISTPQHHARPLENLDESAGVDLLRQIGVRGPERDLRDAVKAYKGHALALRLLGNLLVECFPQDPDIRKRDTLPHLREEEKLGGHAWRVMEAYVAWIDEKPEKKPGFWGNLFKKPQPMHPEIALLHVLGLFDRPVPVGAIGALLTGKAITGLTDALRGIDESSMRKAINHLAKLGLLTEIPLTDGLLPQNTPNLPALRQTAAIDAHPLVREHFGERLEKKSPAAWREANLRLFEYYRNLPEEHLPDTLEEMEPLFTAMAFGCQAGEQQKALDEVYWERIRRGGEAYSIKKLGAFGSDLNALANLFERVWSQPSQNMSIAAQAIVLSWAGFGLRGLGRLLEAMEPMKASMEMLIKQNAWEGAAMNASNLSEFHLSIGQVQEAVHSGRQAVEYADQSENDFLKIISRGTLACALHQAGEAEEASTWFEAAEAMQRKSQPEYRFFYSVRGYQYCDLLLGLGRWKEVLERSETTLEWAIENNLSLLTKALDQLSIGLAHAQAAVENPDTKHEQAATKYLNLAVEGLRKAGTTHMMPLGLLARAAWHRQNRRYTEALTDLQEVLEIAEFGHMGLFLADYHIEMGRLARAQGHHEAAEQHKSEALARVKKTGYLRRLGEAEGI